MSTDQIAQGILDSRGVSNLSMLGTKTMKFLNDKGFNQINENNAAKCCTPKKTCNSEPKCAKAPPLTNSQLFYYYLVFDVFVVLTRWAIAKNTESKLSLALWIQVQLFTIYILYYIFVFIFEKAFYIYENMIYFLGELFSVGTPNPYFDWFGLSNQYYWLNKLYCLIFFGINFAILTAIICSYLLIVAISLPFLVGYYSMDLFL